MRVLRALLLALLLALLAAGTALAASPSLARYLPEFMRPEHLRTLPEQDQASPDHVSAGLGGSVGWQGEATDDPGRGADRNDGLASDRWPEDGTRGERDEPGADDEGAEERGGPRDDGGGQGIRRGEELGRHNGTSDEKDTGKREDQPQPAEPSPKVSPGTGSPDRRSDRRAEGVEPSGGPARGAGG